MEVIEKWIVGTGGVKVGDVEYWLKTAETESVRGKEGGGRQNRGGEQRRALEADLTMTTGLQDAGGCQAR